MRYKNVKVNIIYIFCTLNTHDTWRIFLLKCLYIFFKYLFIYYKYTELLIHKYYIIFGEWKHMIFYNLI